jgi:hypothetical protein
MMKTDKDFTPRTAGGFIPRRNYFWNRQADFNPRLS